MNAATAYKSIISKQTARKNKAHDEGWSLPEYHGARVVMRNVKTGEVATGTRRWAASADRWSLRVSFPA